jgi:MoxR-like ATPase
LIELQDAAAQVKVDDAIVDYMLTIVEQTRNHEHLTMGVSPRGAQALFRAAQALAAVDGRPYVTPDDVKQTVLPVCAHRVMVNTRAVLPDRTGPSTRAAEEILTEILKRVDVPL